MGLPVSYHSSIENSSIPGMGCYAGLAQLCASISVRWSTVTARQGPILKAARGGIHCALTSSRPLHVHGSAPAALAALTRYRVEGLDAGATRRTSPLIEMF